MGVDGGKGENRPRVGPGVGLLTRLGVWSTGPELGPVVGLYRNVLLTTAGPAVVEALLGRGPK